MKPLNILVVDDEAFICEIVADMLEYKGHKTTGATNAHEGLALFQQSDYDVVLTDYRMPNLNGPALAQRMKALKPGVPICLITGTLDELPSRDKGDFAAVVRKPFTIENLANAIESALANQSTVQTKERAPRYPVNWRVDYIFLGSDLFAQTTIKPRQTVLRNLAEGGIAFVAFEELPISGLCAFLVHPPHPQKPFLMIGQIRWQQEIEGLRITGTKWLLGESDQEKNAAVEYAQMQRRSNVSG